MKQNICGVQIDKITETDACEQILGWLKTGGKHYVVTPNIEMLMLTRADPEFKKIINKADLAIPDSSRFNWVLSQQNDPNPITRLLRWPFFFFPKLIKNYNFPVTTGTDLMRKIIRECSDQGFTIGLLGGELEVADRLRECLKKDYPKLKIGMVESRVWVDKTGEVTSGQEYLDRQELGIDILFVAFGHGKQEKWIAKNLNSQKVKVMMGVGGAFDYLSGSVPRAPKWIRDLGFEWLYRGMIEPWRLVRFIELLKFTIIMLFNPKFK